MIHTDAELTAEAAIIANETTPGANTAARIGGMFQDMIDSKVNIGASGIIQAPPVAISSAEILQLFTTPKELVAAPGAGKIIMPVRILIKSNFLTTAYTTNLNLVAGNNSLFTSTFSNALGFTGNQLAGYAIGQTGSQSPPDSIINVPFNLSVATGNPLAGDGDIIVYLLYSVITL